MLALHYNPVLYRYKIVDGKEEKINDMRMFVIPTEEAESQIYPDEAKRGECLISAHL